ncbi:MAG: ABC transporter ATP-binding protein [Ilumatobacteraceae bacterium]
MTLSAQIALRLGTLDLHADLDVKPGELLALLGPNGAGKSTVLRCLAGLAPIDSGVITIDVVVVDDPSTDTFVEPENRPIGFVFQNYLLFEHMSVLENVAYGLRARKTPKVEARRIAREWLDRVRLADYADQRPRALSGGQAQRAALARALATNPRLLLLDEPLAALDAGTRSGVRRDLRRHLASFDGMRILVTHDPVDAYALADRVAILDSGRIVQVGTLAEVTAHPRSRYVADLVGVNLVTGVVTDGVLTTEAGARVVIADALPGLSFAVIRPHSISLVARAGCRVQRAQHLVRHDRGHRSAR